ncbi:coiled-coil domain-containing protein [Bacteroidota bacterium]
MKKYLLLLLIPVFFACGRQAKKQAEELQSRNDSLMTQALQKDEAINDFISSINDIQSTLDTIKMKENIISLSTDRGGELRVSAKEQIKSDIQKIYSLMQKNRETLNSLQRKIKNSNLQVGELQKLVDRVNKEIALKNAEIEELREKLAKMNINIEEAYLKIDDLSQTVQVQSDKISDQTEKIEQQTTALNTAYYIIGTAKDLKDKEVIKGGFLSSKEVLDDFSKSDFTKIDIRKTTEIPILSKKAEVLSKHPTSSYKLTGDKKLVQALQITDPKAFWSVTKYLVIVTD